MNDLTILKQNVWKTFLVKIFKKRYYMAKKYTLPIGKGFYVSKIIFIRLILYRCCFQGYTLNFFYKQLRSGPSTESCLVKPEIPVLKVA